MIIVQGNSVSGSNSYPFIVKFATLGDLFAKEDNSSYLRETYPEMADLLYCMWGKESSFGQDKRRGDNGLAYGDFQIHIDKHPVTERCALDFECAANYTAKKIKEGYGYLWSSYKKCQ